LHISADPLSLGLVFALIGIPRAAFILVGGAVVDHYSPQRVLMLSKFANLVLLGILGALALTSRLDMWMLYVLATAIGLATAFSIPSSTAMLPEALPQATLQAANSVMLSLRQAAMFLGPLLAGGLIATSSRLGAGGSISNLGFGLSFMLDALTFALSAWTLAQVVPNAKPVVAADVTRPGVVQMVAEGLRFFWRDTALRNCFLYGTCIAFFISGPMQVAIPVLAVKLQSPAALGVLMGANGAGTLLGMTLSGVNPTWRLRSLGTTILALDCIAGALFIPMGYSNSVWTGSILMLGIGLSSGFLQVALFTWIQKRVPLVMMGRAMSLFMFVVVGVAPISASLTGWVLRLISLNQLFVASGVLLISTVLIASLTSSMDAVTDVQPADPAK
jgi:MFS family permease